jgi:hypothetical protein
MTRVILSVILFAFVTACSPEPQESDLSGADAGASVQSNGAGTSVVKQQLSCFRYCDTYPYQYNTGPTICCPTPNLLPGFSFVDPWYEPAWGEIVMCTGPDLSGNWYAVFCQKTAMGAGGVYNLADMGDWKRYEYNAVRSVKYRMQGVSTFYHWTNWGAPFSYSRPYDWYSWTFARDDAPMSFSLHN